MKDIINVDRCITTISFIVWLLYDFLLTFIKKGSQGNYILDTIIIYFITIL